MTFESILKRCLPISSPLPNYDWEKMELPFFEIGNRYHTAKIVVIRRDGRLVPSIFEGIGFSESLGRYFDIEANVSPKKTLTGDRFVKTRNVRDLIDAVKNAPNHTKTFRENLLRLAILASKPQRRRPKKLNNKALGRIKYWARRGISKKEIAQKLGISRPTLYRAFELIREIDAQRLADAYNKEREIGNTQILSEQISDRAWKYALSHCRHKDPQFFEYACAYHLRTMNALDSEIFRPIYFAKFRELQKATKTNMRGFEL